MAFRLLLILLFSLSAYSDDSTNICFKEQILNSDCICEYLLLPDHTDPDITSKLTCVNGDAFQAAIEAKKSRNNLIFVNIQISGSALDTVRHHDLKNFQAAEQINLSENKISLIEKDAFKNLKKLEVLELSSNSLPVLQDYAFKHLFHLKNLSVSNNKIHSIEFNTFYDLHNLLHLDLSRNNLSSVDNWFASLKNLQILLLSHNQIASIANSSFSSLLHLQKLDLSFNYLKIIPSNLFSRLKNLNYLSLAMNELETLEDGTFKGNNMLEKVNLTGNLWVCDKKLLPLHDWLKKYETYKEGAKCIEPHDLQNYTVQHALEILYLQLKIQESPTCNATMCNCTISKDKLVVTVDCSSRGFVRLPEVVPYKTKALNLYNNKIRSLNIDHINATLWSDVSFLYLNNNIIDSVKGLEGNWLLKNLVALHLSNNRLTEIPIHILEQIRGGLLDELYLSGNPWTCDCNTVRFQAWLQDNYRTVRNFDGICCSADSGIYANLPIYRLKKSQLCPQQVQLVNPLDIVNGLMGVIIVIIFVKLSYDYWLQKRTGKLPRFFSLNL
ncbi:slit homolog 3 protein-like [Argiope bruennichi]|uniref:Slit like protein n=1 Tax=Argiope bruennichi TaxID=94029 RepID=A0A8T0E192_ARGBR|nr:slit homolog 3 protein-like [Argiope bruennichi]KAF8763701.1 Slit like protein [Argiope bruennichi]